MQDKDVDVNDVLKGMKEVSQNIPSKLTRDEVFELCLELEKQKFEREAQNNLEKSVAFLKEIDSQDDIQVTFEEQYIFLKDSEELPKEYLAYVGHDN